jgi:hypothetical protein
VGNLRIKLDGRTIYLVDIGVHLTAMVEISALAYVRCLASAVEKAMKLTNNMAAKKQHVHSCSLVRARKYYGYHPAEQLFIKIVLYPLHCPPSIQFC